MIPLRIRFQRKGLNIVVFRGFFICLFFIKESSLLSFLGEFCFVEVRLSTVSLFKGDTCLLQANLLLKLTGFIVLFDSCMELQLMNSIVILFK